VFQAAKDKEAQPTAGTASKAVRRNEEVLSKCRGWFKLCRRSAAVRMDGEHRSAQIGPPTALNQIFLFVFDYEGGSPAALADQLRRLLGRRAACIWAGIQTIQSVHRHCFH
jgi:hypothetical protein